MDSYNPKYMLLAIKEAEKARGLCSPNPFVGAVIVKDDVIISKGHTQIYGSHHAEVMAISKAKDKAAGASLYVTLEPCSHYGKTPPCTKAIIESGISTVYVGISDPNPIVSGNGIKTLREHGIEVTDAHFKWQIQRQLESYLHRLKHGRPFVTWKAALSLDGKFAADNGSSKWISCERARLDVHRLRQQSDAIITGINTVLADDPMLNVRLPRTKRHPKRVILDAYLMLPSESQIAQSAMDYPTIVFHGASYDPQKQASLLEMGIKLIEVPSMAEQIDLPAVMVHLHNLGINSLLLECGTALAEAFQKANLIDKYLFYFGPMLLGGQNAILGNLGIPSIDAAIPLTNLQCRKIGKSILVSAYPQSV